MRAVDAVKKAHMSTLFDLELVNAQALWVDEYDVGHVEKCPGKHCGHYGCGLTDEEIADDTPHYCTQCDPESYQ